MKERPPIPPRFDFVGRRPDVALEKFMGDLGVLCTMHRVVLTPEQLIYAMVLAAGGIGAKAAHAKADEDIEPLTRKEWDWICELAWDAVHPKEAPDGSS